MRAIRGAITVEEDSVQAIRRATEALIDEIVRLNGLHPQDVISVVFTLTSDLRAGFPGYFARRHGWSEVPMLHAREIEVPGSLPRCIRALLHVEREPAAPPVRHVYLNAARSLRPDLREYAS